MKKILKFFLSVILLPVAVAQEIGRHHQSPTFQENFALFEKAIMGHDNQLVLSIIESAKNDQTILDLLLHVALECSADYEVIERLIVLYKTGVNTKGRFGWTPLFQAITNPLYKDRYDIAELLLDYGADINATDRYNWTLLDWAKANNDDAAIKFLHYHGIKDDSKPLSEQNQ